MTSQEKTDLLERIAALESALTAKKRALRHAQTVADALRQELEHEIDKGHRLAHKCNELHRAQNS